MATPQTTAMTKPIDELLKLYTNKLSKSILPPDPLRVVEFVLRVPVTVEHVLPIPPVLEKVHSEITEPVIESLPRLPFTGDFPEFKWKEWKVP